MLGRVLSLGNIGSMVLIWWIRIYGPVQVEEEHGWLRFPAMRPLAYSSERPVTTDVIKGLESWPR